MPGAPPKAGRFAPRSAHPASPLCIVCSPLVQSVRAARLRPAQAVRVLASAARGRRVMVRHSRSGHALRFYIRPHFGEVAGSRCAKAPLGASHRCAPSRVSKTGLMQSGLRSATGASAVSASRSLVRPPRCRLCALALVRRWGVWSGASRSVLVSGLRPSCGVCPRPPWASPLRGIGPRGLPVRPPRGSLSPRALRLSH